MRDLARHLRDALRVPVPTLDAADWLVLVCGALACLSFLMERIR